MPTPYSDVAHLLRRAGFGGTPNQISALALYDLAQVVDHVLDVSTAPAVTPPALVLDNAANSYERWVTGLQWWHDRMATTPAPIVEKMTLFWHNHFVSSADKSEFTSVWQQLGTFRRLALGSFTNLAQAAAIDPAMLDYLDNRTNYVGAPNDNFARECMELFTMGPSNYTEADVVAGARAWTGHSTSSDRLTYAFKANRHDNGNKTIFGITKNWNGPDVINEICTGSKQQATARFIATKIWTWFAHANPPSDVVDALAGSFITSNMNITALLRTMFLRPEFYSAAAKQGHVRTPVEFVVAAMRYTGLAASAIHPEWYLAPMGQQLMYPPDVSGWRGNEAWVSTSTMWARSNFARNLCWVAQPTGLLAGSRDASVATAAQRTFDIFGIDNPSVASRAALQSAITAERTARGWAEEHNLITLGLLLPEFQVA